MEVFRKAPNVVVICVTVIVCATIAGVVILLSIGKDVTQLESYVRTLLEGLSVFSGAGAFVYAAAGARSGHSVERRLNGELTRMVRDEVRKSVNQHNTHPLAHHVTPGRRP